MLYANARPVTPDPQPARGGVAAGPDPRLPRMNPDGRVVTFGAVSTNGGLRLSLEGGVLQLTPLPAGLPFTARIRWSDLPWKLPEPKEAEAVDQDGRVVRRQPVSLSGREIQLACEPGVFAYRFR
jgi:hypothetical protein